MYAREMEAGVRVRDSTVAGTVRETARPVFLPGGPRAALLLHGLSGTPREMTELGTRLHADGFTVSIPRLPGHGTNGEDFRRSGWRDWLAAATGAYNELRSRSDGIYLAGLSMGGDLAVVLAAREPFRRMALIAPALRVKNPLLAVAPLLRPFVKRFRTRLSETFQDEDDRYMAEEYWRWRYPGPLAELLSLQRMAVKALPRIRVDTLTVIGTADRTVPLSVLRLVEERVGARTERLVLEGCGHRVFRDRCGDSACARIARWFADADGKGET
jgi:carboxylesterase